MDLFHQTSRQILFVDPGKNSLITISNGKGKYFQYSMKNYLESTRREKYQKILKNFCNFHGISYISEILSFENLSSKTNIIEEYNNYFIRNEQLMNDINPEIINTYKIKLIKLSWWSYLQKKRTEKEIIRKIINEYGENILLIYGDWKEGQTMKYQQSTPSVRIMQILSNKFPLFLIDEYNSSKLYYENNKVTKNFEIKYKNYNNENVSKKLHSVLTSIRSVGNGRVRQCFINRDKNAVNNFSRIFYYYLSYNKRMMAFDRNHINKHYFKNNITDNNINIIFKSSDGLILIFINIYFFNI